MFKIFFDATVPLPLLPEPLPGQEATLQALALGEEARCFQGPADLDEKMNKRCTESYEKVSKMSSPQPLVRKQHAKVLPLDLMQGTQYLAPTLVRNVKFSSFGNTAEMVCREKTWRTRSTFMTASLCCEAMLAKLCR